MINFLITLITWIGFCLFDLYLYDAGFIGPGILVTIGLIVWPMHIIKERV